MSTAVLTVTSEAGEVIVPAGRPRFIIGRARNADHVIADGRVSRQHLMIEETDRGWAVRDVSSNGTWVDGSRMLHTVELHAAGLHAVEPQAVEVGPVGASPVVSRGEARFRLGTSTGPEVVIRTEPPSPRSAPDELPGGGADMQTMLPHQTGYLPPRTANQATRPPRREDLDAGRRATPAGATPAGATPAGATPAGASSADATPIGASSAGATPVGASSARAVPGGASSAGATPVGASSAGAVPAGAAHDQAERGQADGGQGDGGQGDGGQAERGGHARLDREHERGTTYPLRPGTMTIGRARDNDIVISDLLASRHHASLTVQGPSVELVDLDSANGTFHDGRRIQRAQVEQGDIIAIGHHVFQLEGNLLVEYLDSGDVSFEAEHLNVWAGEKQLMHDMTFRLPGRALLGVVGPSGAGKSTLLNALTGFRPADSGAVRYAGRDLYTEYDELRRRIGYVPQDDILHASLTVRKALEFGATLRFPPDVTESERARRIDEVLAELNLTPHADTVVAKLSGGQRKRVSVALELLTRPTLLYLDEPTSGLDPGMDLQVMQSLRTLADDGRTVIVVTHSVAQLDLCDYVLVLAPGGYVAYFGPPRDALPFFGEQGYPWVFLRLQETPGAESAARFRQSRHYVPASVTAPSARPAPEELPSIRQQSVLSQLVTLSRRTLAVIASDKGYLRLAVAFPFVLGLIPRAINGNFADTHDRFTPNSDGPTIFLIMVLCACFMGMSNSVREIVKERAIYQRERAIGLSRGAYVGSKVGVLFIITVLQVIPFTLIGLVGRQPPGHLVFGNTLLECMLAVFVVGFASGMIGLMISALVDNADKTMPLLVIVTMVQLVFSAGIVPIGGKAGLEQVAVVSPARWGFAAMAADADFNTITRAGVQRPKTVNGVPVAGQTVPVNPRAPEPDRLFSHTKKQYLTDLGAGFAAAAVYIAITYLLLRRLDPKRSRRRKPATQ
ncbi:MULTISPECIES: FHA domain-containing protein [Frankia]|uniref:ABC transporter n=1 Tax=Frankia alni (strain DSM 45986 / CECT 9034 / ACN14a) TaxID=326424 RepID=Q0RI76_FRAAA|nr:MULTISPECIES: ATP-binding cassette domain-containing protein [Frankia]CAJ62795.1 Putative ABC transporter [Frankia alni ACN14a]